MPAQLSVHSLCVCHLVHIVRGDGNLLRKRSLDPDAITQRADMPREVRRPKGKLRQASGMPQDQFLETDCGLSLQDVVAVDLLIKHQHWRLEEVLLQPLLIVSAAELGLGHGGRTCNVIKHA